MLIGAYIKQREFLVAALSPRFYDDIMSATKIFMSE